MTGTRTAGLIDCIPLRATISKHEIRWLRYGFTWSISRIVLATWIDNLFAFAKSDQDAVCILSDFRAAIEVDWALDFDAVDHCFISRFGKGGADRINGWRRVQHFKCVGHYVSRQRV